MTAKTANKPAPKSKKHNPEATERLRKSALKEIKERIDRAEQADAPAGPTRTALRSDGSPVKVSVPGEALPTPPAKQEQAEKQAQKPKAPAVAKLAKPAKGEGAPKQLGGLDAAAIVLKAANCPLTSKEIWAKIDEKKMWFTEGKTPEATIYSAMIREIAAKKAESRFKKAARGKFEYAKE